MNFKRVFLIILDSLGIGELPDANAYGDEGSNTLRSISKSKHFFIPNLMKMGLGNIDGVDYLFREPKPIAKYARLAEASSGKDTTIGHFEIAGLISEKPFPTYANGFPTEIVEELERRCNVKTICNKPYSGTKVIEDYGDEHIETGSLILYTSADSVLQLAAHERYFGLERLYNCCKIAREIMVGEHNIGRIIARPFDGESGGFYRTANRHDYAVQPIKDTMLDVLKANDYEVISIGKIYDIFAGKGLTESNPTKSNQDGMDKCYHMLERKFKGLCFVNLVDFDMLYGHRNDIDGYAKALSEFDLWLGNFTDKMLANDCLIINADHGCDPATVSTDHSREYIPALFMGKGIEPVNIGTRRSFADIGKTIVKLFGLNENIDGEAIDL